MTGKVLDNNNPAALALIFPIVLVIFVLLKTWWLLLFLVFLGIVWKIWQNYRWKKWSSQVNPFFNQLIKDNQGCLTAMDLSLKANLTGKAAEVFLDKKAEEYGAQRRMYQDKGVVYYFLTAGSLSSIFENSEPLLESDEEQLASETTPIVDNFPEASVSDIAQLVELENQEPLLDNNFSEPSLPETSENMEALAEFEESDLTESETREIEPDESLDQQQITDLENLNDEETPDESSIEVTSSDEFFSQAKLAERLKVNPRILRTKKFDADFSEWSKSIDYEGIAWKYLVESKKFVRVDLE